MLPWLSYFNRYMFLQIWIFCVLITENQLKCSAFFIFFMGLKQLFIVSEQFKLIFVGFMGFLENLEKQYGGCLDIMT